MAELIRLKIEVGLPTSASNFKAEKTFELEMNSTATIGDLKLKVRERAREADIDGAMNKFYECDKLILLDDDSRPLRDYNFPMGTVYFLDQVLVIKDTGKKHKDDFVSQWALANAELLAVSSGKSTVLHYIVKQKKHALLKEIIIAIDSNLLNNALNVTNEKNQTVLDLAKKKSPKCVEALLEIGGQKQKPDTRPTQSDIPEVLDLECLINVDGMYMPMMASGGYNIPIIGAPNEEEARLFQEICWKSLEQQVKQRKVPKIRLELFTYNRIGFVLALLSDNPSIRSPLNLDSNSAAGVFNSAQAWIEDSSLDICIPKIWRVLFMKDVLENRSQFINNHENFLLYWDNEQFIVGSIQFPLDKVAEGQAKMESFFSLLWARYCQLSINNKGTCIQLLKQFTPETSLEKACQQLGLNRHNEVFSEESLKQITTTLPEECFEDWWEKKLTLSRNTPITIKEPVNEAPIAEFEVKLRETTMTCPVDVKIAPLAVGLYPPFWIGDDIRCKLAYWFATPANLALLINSEKKCIGKFQFEDNWIFYTNFGLLISTLTDEEKTTKLFNSIMFGLLLRNVRSVCAVDKIDLLQWLPTGHCFLSSNRPFTYPKKRFFWFTEAQQEIFSQKTLFNFNASKKAVFISKEKFEWVIEEANQKFKHVKDQELINDDIIQLLLAANEHLWEDKLLESFTLGFFSMEHILGLIWHSKTKELLSERGLNDSEIKSYLEDKNLTLHIKVLQLLQFDELSADWIRVITVMRKSRNDVAHGRSQKINLTAEKVEALIAMCLNLVSGERDFDDSWKALWIQN